MDQNKTLFKNTDTTDGAYRAEQIRKPAAWVLTILDEMRGLKTVIDPLWTSPGDVIGPDCATSFSKSSSQSPKLGQLANIVTSSLTHSVPAPRLPCPITYDLVGWIPVLMRYCGNIQTWRVLFPVVIVSRKVDASVCALLNFCFPLGKERERDVPNLESCTQLGFYILYSECKVPESLI